MRIGSGVRWGGVAGVLCVAGLAGVAGAQALPTASRRADLQAGVLFSLVKPDTITNNSSTNWHAYGFYADLDVRRHLGLEFDFHQAKGSDPILYERTYNVGPRFLYPIYHERLVPYAKVMYGRGVFNFAGTDASGKSVNVANLAYNIYSFGGGVDLRVVPSLNVRVLDFEYQRWPGYPPNGLNPLVISAGVAYHFHGRSDMRR